MGKSIARTRKRRFHGNRYTKQKQNDNCEANVAAGSSSNLHASIVTDSEIPDKILRGNRIFDVEVLVSMFSDLCCPNCLSVGLNLCEDSVSNLSANFTLKCKNCEFLKDFSSTDKR